MIDRHTIWVMMVSLDAAFCPAGHAAEPHSPRGVCAEGSPAAKQQQQLRSLCHSRQRGQAECTSALPVQAQV